MQTIPWIDQLRNDLLATEAYLRPLIRAYHYSPRVDLKTGPRTGPDACGVIEVRPSPGCASLCKAGSCC